MNPEKQDFKKTLLSDPHYIQAIKATKKIAKEDYRIVDQALKPVERALQDLQDALKRRLGKIEIASNSNRVGKTQQEALSDLKKIYQRLTDARAIDLDELRSNLRSKKKSVGNFTLVIMGRTKAGKSTLFATLLDTGYDGIGSGQQRTTRENKSYNLKNDIRLIDTPGIAAVGGHEDESEALKAVQEADLVCYIVTNDSVQVAEFEFLGKLKNQKKPLIILLNIQHNLQDERRLVRFLKNPEKLMCDVEIEESKKRIFRYAREYYQNDSITVIPVMLLAAQLSRQREDLELREKLYQSSRIYDFLNYVRDAIEQYGTLLASHLMLRETAIFLQHQADCIGAESKVCQDVEEKLRKKQEEFSNRLDRVHEKIQTQIETEVKAIFQPAINQIPNFARQHWHQNNDKQIESWKNFFQDKQKFDQKLKNSSETIQSDYQHKIKDILDEISQDLRFEAQAQNASGYSAINPGFDFRGLFDFGAKLANLAILLPGAGWVVGIFAGVAFKLMGGFFDSNEVRRAKAINAIEKKSKDILESQRDKTIEFYKKDVSKMHERIKESIFQYFVGINKELKHIYEILGEAEQEIQNAHNHILKLFGLRALYWCRNEVQNFREFELNQILNIDCSGQKLIIKVKDTANLPPSENTEKCNQFLGEEIIFSADNSKTSYDLYGA